MSTLLYRQKREEKDAVSNGEKKIEKVEIRSNLLRFIVFVRKINECINIVLHHQLD